MREIARESVARAAVQVCEREALERGTRQASRRCSERRSVSLRSAPDRCWEAAAARSPELVPLVPLALVIESLQSRSRLRSPLASLELLLRAVTATATASARIGSSRVELLESRPHGRLIQLLDARHHHRQLCAPATERADERGEHVAAVERCGERVHMKRLGSRVEREDRDARLVGGTRREASRAPTLPLLEIRIGSRAALTCPHSPLHTR